MKQAITNDAGKKENKAHDFFCLRKSEIIDEVSKQRKLRRAEYVPCAFAKRDKMFAIDGAPRNDFSKDYCCIVVLSVASFA